MRQHALAALVLAASVLVPHWPRGPAEFTYDDRGFIELNQSVRSLREAAAALLEPFPPDQPERGLYRPLTSLSYALDYELGGGGARAFHRTNTLLYLAIVALVYRLALVYGRSRGFAFSLALLFAVHPVHCDAVDAIAGRSELLALLFSLVALLAWLRAERGSGARARWLAASVSAYALACASKETGVVLPALLAVHAWVLPLGPRAGARRAALLGLAPYALVLGLYLAARLAALGHFAPSEPYLRGVSPGLRLHTVGSVFLEYLRLLVFPRVLQVDFYYQQVLGIATGATARSLAGLALAIGAVLALAALLVRARRAEAAAATTPASDAALAACALAIFLGFLFPVSHVLDIGALLAERFLFAPSLGFLLGVVLAGSKALAGLATRPRAALACALVGVLAGAGALRSAARAGEWRDAAALWASATRALPADPHSRANLASHLIGRGELDAAADLLEESLRKDPEQLELLGNLGTTRLAQGRYDEAVLAYHRILLRHPDDFVTWNNLGVVEVRRNRLTRAVPFFQRALELNANFAEARRNLEASEHHVALARDFIAARRAEAAASGDPALLGRVARACEATGDDACAREFGERARKAAESLGPQGST